MQHAVMHRYRSQAGCIGISSSLLARPAPPHPHQCDASRPAPSAASWDGGTAPRHQTWRTCCGGGRAGRQEQRAVGRRSRMRVGAYAAGSKRRCWPAGRRGCRQRCRLQELMLARWATASAVSSCVQAAFRARSAQRHSRHAAGRRGSGAPDGVDDAARGRLGRLRIQHQHDAHPQRHKHSVVMDRAPQARLDRRGGGGGGGGPAGVSRWGALRGPRTRPRACGHRSQPCAAPEDRWLCGR